MQSLIVLISLMLGVAEPAASPPASEGFIAAADGVRLYYRIEGSGPETLVVVHFGKAHFLS